jgi:ribonuclease P protein component
LSHVEDISTEEKEAGEDSWVSGAAQDAGWQARSLSPTGKRASKIDGVIGRRPFKVRQWHMISKRSRLPREAFKAGGYRKINTPFFSLREKDNGISLNRIGVIVGKSVDKRAVRRNFWERQVKARLRKLPPAGKDLMVIVFPGIEELTREEFGKIFEQSLGKLKNFT